MFIATFLEPEREVQTSDELRREMMFRHDSTFACFWLWHEKPVTLAIMINGDDAYLLFVPQADHPGWWAAGRDGENEIPFLADNYEPTPMARMYTVTTAQAEEAAAEFLKTSARPTCLEWVEL